MSFCDEEKKAIEDLKKLKLGIGILNMFCEEKDKDKTDIKAIEIVLNLIEKQQKEIENSVSKDKIREEIKENNKILEKNYSAKKICVFSGNTYMEKLKLLGKNEALNKLLEE